MEFENNPNVDVFHFFLYLYYDPVLSIPMNDNSMDPSPSKKKEGKNEEGVLFFLELLAYYSRATI